MMAALVLRGQKRSPTSLARGDLPMTELKTLEGRIDGEFTAVEEKVKKLQAEQAEGDTQRQNRLEQLAKVFEKLQGIRRPRLELLIEKFRGRVEATPRIVRSTREVTLKFQSPVARLRLKFSATTDRDIKNIILSCDLGIIPVMMRFNPHSEAEFPLNAVDEDAVAQWIDDRIVEFVHTYFSLEENNIYLREQMVEDPVAHVRFPKFAAAASLEWQGQKLYFIGEETRQEFEKQQGITGQDEGTERRESGESTGQGSASRGAEWSAQELSELDEKLRQVDQAIGGADSTRKRVYPKEPDLFEEH
jgi:hypothetical protein